MYHFTPEQQEALGCWEWGYNAVGKGMYGNVFDDARRMSAVMWAGSYGITSGYSDGTFGVNKTCTRGQCVTFLYRLIVL